jgi:hypothetical protein
MIRPQLDRMLHNNIEDEPLKGVVTVQNDAWV